jgi:hypothetical protein
MEGGMRIHASQALVFALVVTCAGCSGGGDDDEKSDAAPAARSAASSGDVEREGGDSTELRALVDLVISGAGRLPRAEFDPAALARQLGKDPKAHFEWVRDHTWWAPYRGLLRGSRGVLLDRLGSNLDRAVLLGELLTISGHEVRLAHSELSHVRARELLGKLRSTPDARTRSAAQGRAPDERQPIEDQASALVDAQANELYAMVKGAGGTTGATDERTAIDAMRDYWWVERKVNGEWQAMDILLADTSPGTALAEASSVSAWNAEEGRPEVPESDWHTVRLRVVIERYADGETTESTVLEHILRPAEALEDPIMLMHAPSPWPQTLPDPAADPSALGNAAVNVKEWVPILQIGSEFVAQSGFTDDGNLIASPFDSNRDVAEAGGAGFMSGFGEALGGGETASSAMTAEWLDYEIQVPGEAAQRLRRPVFDLLGPARRTARAADFDASTNERLIERYEALLSTTQVLLQVSDYSAEFLTHLGTRSIVENQAAIRELSKERDADKARMLAAEILDRLDTWGPLPALALWRAELGGQPRRSFVDRPNVLNYRIGGPVVNADRVAFREQIDIASNSTGVTWGAGQDPFATRLRQGVADTVAEVLVLGGDFRTTHNTAVLFDRAGNDPDRVKLIDARNTSEVQGLEWPEDAIGRLVEDVGSGFMAVALRRPASVGDRPRLGWWRIDPGSGATIGVMDTGLHGAMDERVATEIEIVQLRNSLRNWLSNNASRIRAARERANVPWNAARRGDAELLQTTDRVMDVLRQVAQAGF